MLSTQHDVTVFAPFGADIAAAGYRLVTCDQATAARGRWRSAFQILRYLRRTAEQFDIINCHHALLSLLLPVESLVTTYHGYRGRLNFMFGKRAAGRISDTIRHQLIGRSLRRSRAVTLVSRSLEDEVTAADVTRPVVIYNGVDIGPSPRSDAAEGSGTYFLYLGRVDPDKSVDQLISLYSKTSLPMPLLIAGDGADRARLQQQCQDPRVCFVGSQMRDALPGLLSGARAFVTASTYETFCLPVIEAALLGRPAIGPNSGALPEVIADGETGFLYDTNNPESFAAVLERLAGMAQPDIETMAIACRKWATRFSWAECAAAYERLYQSICNDDSA